MYRYIYKTIIPTSDGLKFYIGQHKANKFDINYFGSGIKLKKWIFSKTNSKIKAPYSMSSKIGAELGLKVEILATAENVEELNLLEEKYVNSNLNDENCWNLLEGGNYTITKGFSGHKHSEKTKKLLRDMFFGKKISEETKLKISKANTGKPSPKGMLGKHLSKESIQKILETKKKNGTLKLKPETIEKIKIAKQNISEETRKRMSEAQKRRIPVLHTNEYKNHMSTLYSGEGNPCFGKTCWNNGEINKFSAECPGEGWIKGRLKKKRF